MSNTPVKDIDTLTDSLKTFMDSEVIPIESMALAQGFNAALPKINQLRNRAKELGFWTPQIPKQWGGVGLSLEDFGRVSEVLGQSPFGHLICNCQAPDAGNMEILIEYGSEEQQERFLKPLLEGSIRSCFAMTEPEFAGSNPINLGTTAVLDGDEYVINGHKWFTSSADGADFAIVMAVTDESSENPYAKASQIIVPLDTPGYEFVRNISVMGEPGEGQVSHAEIRFNDCRVPASNILGGPGMGFMIAQQRLGPGRIHHCMRWIGICERAFDLMCKYAVSRELAPGKPLSSRQVIQHWIAECRAEINASRFMVLDTAKKIDERGTYEVRTEISLIKFYVAGVLQKVLDRAIQVHGALGVTDDTPLAWFFRHERGARIYDGADEVHKNRAAREILKAYK